MKSSLHIVWFKHDLRVNDHAALYEACLQGEVLPVFCWDPAIWRGEDYTTQHRNFVQECLNSLALQLHDLGLTLHSFHGDTVQLFDQIAQQYRVAGIYSHEETGNHHSYMLDIRMAAWCKQRHIVWHEYPQNGVVRRLKTRNQWSVLWKKRMTTPLIPLPTSAKMAYFNPQPFQHPPISILDAHPDKPKRQSGGRDAALQYLHSFLNGRASRYRGGISSPLTSELAGSRISPYLSWGVMSIREVVQALQCQVAHIQANPAPYPPRLLAGLAGFESRLHWHCHFMQKLESEPEIEYRNLHSACDGLRDVDYQEPVLKSRLDAWKNGCTGWPLVDACMAMLKETGWINFRMRAMLMSTASHLLWLHWRQTGLHLAREFLDYEPGIHWPQVQMQSGTTGINTLRIYNPIKQAKDQDPEGVFVRHWLPALRRVPNTWIFQPWLMPEALQLEYGCVIGSDYPPPLVDIEQAVREARAKFTALKRNTAHYAETKSIIEKHASRKSRVGKNSGNLRNTKITLIPTQQELF